MESPSICVNKGGLLPSKPIRLVIPNPLNFSGACSQEKVNMHSSAALFSAFHLCVCVYVCKEDVLCLRTILHVSAQQGEDNGEIVRAYIHFAI